MCCRPHPQTIPFRARSVAAALALLFAAVGAPIRPARADRLDVAAADVIVREVQLNDTARAVWTLRGLIRQLNDDRKFQPCGAALAAMRGSTLSADSLAALASCYGLYRARSHSLVRLVADFRRLATKADRAVIPDPTVLDNRAAVFDVALGRAMRAMLNIGVARSIRPATCRPRSDSPILVLRLKDEAAQALASHALLDAQQAFDLARAKLSVSLSEELLCGATFTLADAEMGVLDVMADQLSVHTIADEYRFACTSTDKDVSKLNTFCYQFDGGPSSTYTLLH